MAGFAYHLGLIDYNERMVAEAWTTESLLLLQEGLFRESNVIANNVIEYIVERSGTNEYNVRQYYDTNSNVLLEEYFRKNEVKE
jgi:hypothetical protein